VSLHQGSCNWRFVFLRSLVFGVSFPILPGGSQVVFCLGYGLSLVNMREDIIQLLYRARVIYLFITDTSHRKYDLDSSFGSQNCDRRNTDVDYRSATSQSIISIRWI